MVVKTYTKWRLGEWAVKLGFLTQDQLKYVVSKKNITQQRLGQICVEEGLLDYEDLAQIIAAQYSYKYVTLDNVPATDLLKLVNYELMVKYKFIPYARQGEKLSIAMAEPIYFYKASEVLEMLLDMDIVVVVASQEKINSMLKTIENSQSLLDSASDDMRLPILRDTDRGENTLTTEKVTTEESPIVKLVDSTILDAISKRASDIHIETSDNGIILRYRIDGILHQATEPLDIRHQSAIISRIKVMSELDISEKRIPQDGRFKLKVRDRSIDFRVSILPTIFGEDAVIRILDRQSVISDAGELQLNSMGLPPKDLARIRRMIQAPYGMFIITGPTGSGKTTTLYRALSEVNSKEVKILTIEDPVEYQLKGVVQIPVNEKKGLTFARGLRSILRHDPDKILVGEIRDSETAQIALQAALTGHLVFTTVHANRSFEVINRLLHMGIKPYNLVSALNCIAAQRLIRTLCHCKSKTTISERKLMQSGLNYQKYKNHVFYEAKGCEDCKGTGYRGRKAIMELIEFDDTLREMFIQRTPFSMLKKKAVASGTTFLRKSAINEVIMGKTTLKEINRVTFIEPSDSK